MTTLANGFACDHGTCLAFWRSPGIKRDAVKVVLASDEARKAGWWFDRSTGVASCPDHRASSLDYRRHHDLFIAPDATDAERLYRVSDVVRVRVADKAGSWAAYYRIDKTSLAQTSLDFGAAPNEITPEAEVLERLRSVSAYLAALPFGQRIIDDGAAPEQLAS